jgi:hypothetical protein
MTIYFIYYFVLNTIFDIFSKDSIICIRNHPKILFILILHHFLSSFLLVGWLLQYKPLLLLHIFVVIGTIIYWRQNENLCGLTTYVNNICGWNQEKPFHDLLDIIGLKKLKSWNEMGHYIFIIIGASISLYKINKI